MESRETLRDVISGELNCPSLMQRLARPSGATIADLGLPPMAERKALCDLGMFGMRLCLLI